MRFTKMEGCGNDFLIVDAADLPPQADLSTVGRRLCDRRLGVGADGLIVVRPAEGGAHYRVEFINATGLPAEMCGNGARCVARYAADRGLAPSHHAFETVAGLIRAEVACHRVCVELTEPRDLTLDRRITLDGADLLLDTIDTGVPHAVIWTDDVERADVERLGPRIRYHAAFAPRGTNVNFAQVLGDGLTLRTYERGVEAETLACGTGSAAAAILACRRGVERSGILAPPVRVRTRHGAELTIDFADHDGRIHHVRLTGPTTYICRGEICPNLLA